MFILYIHKRQFIIGEKKYKINDNWSYHQINKNLYLSYCKSLPVSSVKDLNAKTWFILGKPIQTDPNRECPKRELEKFQNSRIVNIINSWDGRWLLISNEHLYMDVTGSLGCFYTYSKGNYKIVSSSPVLLKEIVSSTVESQRIVHLSKMNWYPGPGTRYKDIYRLLPTQTINFSENILEYRPISTGEKFSNYSDILDYLEENILTSIKNIARDTPNIWLPLTGGHDSRLILAACYKARIKVNPFTFYKPFFSDITEADIKLPKKLAKLLGYKHVLVKRGRHLRTRKAIFDQHTGLNCVSNDRNYFAYGQWDLPSPNAVLRGSVLSIGKSNYYKTLPKLKTFKRNDLIESILNTFKVSKEYPKSKSHINGVEGWVEWFLENNDDSIDWRDRFFIEQRIGSWMSSIDQALDLTGSTMIHIGNNSNFINAFLGAPLTKRSLSKCHEDLIKRLAPDLLNYPFNPNDRLFNRIKRRIWRSTTKKFTIATSKIRHKNRCRHGKD